MHVLEFLLCLCALDALHRHHLVRLAQRKSDEGTRGFTKRRARTSSNNAWLRLSSSVSSSFFSSTIFSDLRFSSRSCPRSSSSSLATVGEDATSDGSDADVKWPTAGCGERIGRGVLGGEFAAGCVGVERPLLVKRKRKKRESGWVAVGAGVGAGEPARVLSRSEFGDSRAPCCVWPSSMLVRCG
jgi:hypothetical protein